MKVGQMMISFCDRGEKTLLEKEKMHFLFFPQCFQKASSSGLLKLMFKW